MSNYFTYFIFGIWLIKFGKLEHIGNYFGSIARSYILVYVG